MLYAIYADKEKYGLLGFNRDESRSLFGDNIDNQFDVNWGLKSFQDIWQPMTINFADENGKYPLPIPDISEHHGRLFLSPKAFGTLKEALAPDGEFLPVKYELGEAFMFNPLKFAESVNGVDEKLSQKDEFNDVINLSFHEDRVNTYRVFRSEFSYLNDLICNEQVKKCIEESDLKGVLVTPHLGNRSAAFNPELYLNG